LDILGINSDGEGEASRELADAALADPILLLRLGWLLLLLSDLGVSGWSVGRGCLGGVLIFDGCVVVGLSIVALDGASCLVGFEEAGWRRTGSEGAFGFAADNDCLAIGELDFNVLLIDAWEFAVQLIGFTELLDIELGGEALHDVTATVVVVIVIVRSRASIVRIEVVEESEERVKGGRVVGDKRSWEERHFACGC